MWKRTRPFLPSIGAWVIAGGLQVSGVEIPWLGFSLMALGVILLAIPLYFWLKNRKSEDLAEKRTQSKIMVRGLVDVSKDGNVSHLHFEYEICVNPEDVAVSGLIVQGENTEIVDSSADAEIECEQDKE